MARLGAAAVTSGLAPFVVNASTFSARRGFLLPLFARTFDISMARVDFARFARFAATIAAIFADESIEKETWHLLGTFRTFPKK